MKRPVLILLLIAGSVLAAQPTYTQGKNVNVGIGYQRFAEEDLYGGIIDLTIQRWGKPGSLSFGYGFQSGCFFQKIQETLNVHYDFIYSSIQMTHHVEGYVYSVPFETYFLIGAKDDFLDIGASLNWLQFSGKGQLDYLNQRYVYKQQSYAFLASLHIGFRHQPNNGGLFFRALWKPSGDIETNDYYNSFLVSLGYTF